MFSVLFAPAAAGADSFTVVSYARGESVALNALPSYDRPAITEAESFSHAAAEAAAAAEMGGTDIYEIAKNRAALRAPAGCRNDLDWLWGASHTAITTDAAEGSRTARITITIGAPLCQAVTFELLSATVSTDGTRQVIADSSVHTVFEPGTYTWSVAVPDADGARVEFARHETFGPDGVIAGAVIDHVQRGGAQPTAAIAAATTPRGATSAVAVAPTAQSRRTMLPLAGLDADQMALIGLALVGVGLLLTTSTWRVAQRTNSALLD